MKVAPGPARAELVERGWRTFLVKVRNEAGVTAPLRVSSPHAQRVFSRGPRGFSMDPRPAQTISAADVADRWLDLELFDKPPLAAALSGLEVEYRILQLSSRDAGKREATLAADVGQGSQDIGFRNDAPILFTVRPSVDVTLRVRDEHGQPTVAAFVIRDAQQRVYPSPAKRLAPDFAFHPQVYRADGETVRLAEGAYDVEVSRGPEYVRAAAARHRRARADDGQLRAVALDRPAGAGLVLRRSPHPRRRLPALRDADHRRRAARHDPPHPRRGA